MKRIVVFLILFVLVFSGTCCALRKPKEPIYLSEAIKKTIWIDAAFSEKETELIVLAYHTVECSTNYSLITFEFRPQTTIANLVSMNNQNSIVVVKTTGDDPRIKKSDNKKEMKEKNKYTLGVFLPNEYVPTVLIPYERILNVELFYRVVMHESIHSIGILEHSDNKTAIMYPTMDDTSAEDMTMRDIELICSIYACDTSGLKICKGN